MGDKLLFIHTKVGTMSQRPTFSTEFKLDAVSLVLDQGYTISNACKALNISESALRRWVHQLKQERGGITPVAGKALTPEQRHIQELEAKLKRSEREKEILKKATALLISDSIRSSL